MTSAHGNSDSQESGGAHDRNESHRRDGRRDNATMLAEQGLRVLAAQLIQDDQERQQRVIRGLAYNAVRKP